MASSLIARPRISGNIRESFQYRTMGFGSTSRIVLLGHADGLSLNDPYQVNDIQEAINVLEADSNSPLLRGLLEVYNAGARDIWIVAVAPMNEYIEVDERLQLTQDLMIIDGGAPGSYDQAEIPFDLDGGFPHTIMEEIYTFYQKYYDRLAAAYSVLLDYDFTEIVVPLEASFVHTGGINFVDQLAGFCQNYHIRTGMMAIGVLGTRKPTTISSTQSIEEMVATAASLTSSDGSKYVIVTVGEGAVSIPQLGFTFKSSVAAQVAANISVYPLERGISYTNLSGVVNLEGNDYTTSQLDALVNAKLNPAIRSQKSKRGAPFQTVVLSDNTLASDGSDFWSLSQMRVLAKCSNTVRSLSYGWVGSTDYAGFKQAIYDYLIFLVRSNTIKDFRLNIEKDLFNRNKILVEMAITPFSGIRQVYFTVEVGPGV